jgi:hypothetical protein
MVVELPFIPSNGNYRFGTTIENAGYNFVVRWSTVEACWYFSIFEVNEDPIIQGVKIVTGTYLGRRCAHPLFDAGVFIAIDLASEEQPTDPGFDDLGTRVVVVFVPVQDLLVRLSGGG